MPRVSAKYIQRRRQEIIEAAWRCFARGGFHATTMEDVVAASGASPSVVYRWFRSKEELVEAVVEQALSGVASTMSDLCSTEPPPSLPHTVDKLLESALAETTKDGHQLAALPVQAWAEALRSLEVNALVTSNYRCLLDGFADLVHKHQALGTISAEVSPTELAQPLFSLVPGFLLQNLLVGPVERSRYAESVATLLQGITAEPRSAQEQGESAPGGSADR